MSGSLPIQAGTKTIEPPSTPRREEDGFATDKNRCTRIIGLNLRANLAKTFSEVTEIARFWLVFGAGDNDVVFDSARADIVTVTGRNWDICRWGELR